MKTRRFSHQIKAIQFHIKHNASADFSEQGIGKTWTALALIELRLQRQQINKALILCPDSIIHVWLNEIDKHSSLINPIVLTGPNREEKLEEEGNCYIVSYDSLTPRIVKWAIENCQMVVFDEVHKVKNIKAKRTRLTLPLARIPYRLALSGTLFPNNLTDIFTIAYLIDRGKAFGNSYRLFLKKYFDAYPIMRINAKTTIYKYIPTKLMAQKANQFIKTKSIRFLREHLKDMPNKIYQEIPVNLTPEQEKYYKN